MLWSLLASAGLILFIGGCAESRRVPKLFDFPRSGSSETMQWTGRHSFEGHAIVEDGYEGNSAEGFLDLEAGTADFASCTRIGGTYIGPASLQSWALAANLNAGDIFLLHSDLGTHALHRLLHGFLEVSRSAGEFTNWLRASEQLTFASTLAPFSAAYSRVLALRSNKLLCPKCRPLEPPIDLADLFTKLHLSPLQLTRQIDAYLGSRGAELSLLSPELYGRLHDASLHQQFYIILGSFAADQAVSSLSQALRYAGRTVKILNLSTIHETILTTANRGVRKRYFSQLRALPWAADGIILLRGGYRSTTGKQNTIWASSQIEELEKLYSLDGQNRDEKDSPLDNFFRNKIDSQQSATLNVYPAKTCAK